MKTFLRKATAAAAAMLVSVNAMAQIVDFKKDLNIDIEDCFEWSVYSKFTKDGTTRLIIPESEGRGYYWDSETGRETYEKYLKKLTILNGDLDIEKEFTSGPMFEEVTDIKVKSAAKTLKLNTVNLHEYDEYYVRDFYSGFYYVTRDTIRDDYDEWIDEHWHDYSEIQYLLSPEEQKSVLEEWIKNNRTEENGWYTTTYNGYKVYFGEYDVKTSEYYDWGKKYPEYGFLYKNYNEIYRIYFHYTCGETEEISREDYRTCSTFFVDEIWGIDFETHSEFAATVSQTLFNDDENYEFLLPELKLKKDYVNDNGNGIYSIEYRHRQIGFKIVSENGDVLDRVIIDEAKDNEDVSCGCILVNFGQNKYIIVETYNPEIEEEYTTSFYKINKSTTSIQKVREIRGGMNIRPTVANRNEEIDITLNDNNDVARELIVTGANGQLIERRDIPAGESKVKVNAAMLRSGLYNFTLQKKGKVVDNGKVIVK